MKQEMKSYITTFITADTVFLWWSLVSYNRTWLSDRWRVHLSVCTCSYWV